MLLYPDLYFNNIREIKYENLKEKNVKGIILDVDNTLINYYKQFEEGTIEWIEELKKSEIKFCIVSNSNKEKKVRWVAETLNIPFFYFAKKPFKMGFNKAKKLMQLKSENIAVIGDQILTDVLGANRCNMVSILVKPIEEKDIWITRFKRPLEKRIIEKYLKDNKEREVKKCT